MQYWVESRKRGFAQGITHAFSRLGNAVTPALIVGLMAIVTWRGSFVVVGLAGFVWVALWYWYFRDDPKDHPAITPQELAVLPQRSNRPAPAVPWSPLIARMWPVTLTYFCYGWCLWLYLSFLLIFFKDRFTLSAAETAFFATIVYTVGAIGNTIGGVVSDRILRATNNVRLARVGAAVFGFVGALLSLLPILEAHDKAVVKSTKFIKGAPAAARLARSAASSSEAMGGSLLYALLRLMNSGGRRERSTRASLRER